jgi:pimeloyl-ACP methyl ester carboxylesterase
MEELTNDPTDRRYASQAEAAAAIRAGSPTWSDGDIEAKARALTEFDERAVLDVLVRNGDWDAGMAALGAPDAAGIPVWLIRGDWDTGSLIPDPKVAQIESRLGADHVMTIVGGPHSPHRTHPEATVLAILRALAAA